MTAEIAPSAPTPTRAARSSSGSVAALSWRTLPSARTSSSALDLGRDVAQPGAGAVGPGRDRAGDRLAVDVAEVLHRQPEPGQLLVEVGEDGAAADLDQARAGVGVEHPAAAPSRSIIVPSVIAASVKECPEPATLTFCPAAAAAAIASASSSRLRGPHQPRRPAAPGRPPS